MYSVFKLICVLDLDMLHDGAYKGIHWIPVVWV